MLCTDGDGDASTIAHREGIGDHPKAKERASAREASSSRGAEKALEEKAKEGIPRIALAIL
eukprot:6473366-Amphidinium_carterae.1